MIKINYTEDTAVIPVGIKIKGNCVHMEVEEVEHYIVRPGWDGEAIEYIDTFTECIYCHEIMEADDDEDNEYYED